MKYDKLMELGKAYETLCNQGKLREAAAFLEGALDQFPDYFCELTGALAETYMQLGDFEKALTIIEHGLKKGIFYQIPHSFQEQIPSEFSDQFTKIVDENNRLKELAQARARAKCEVVEPAGYSDKSEYPLFIVLHGGGSNIEFAKIYWKSKILDEFLVAFIQSSEVDSSVGFTWYKRIPQGRKEIKECYKKVTEQYLVDTEKVIIGGFSVGGSMAIDVVFNGVIPVMGFVGGCPGKPESFNREKVEKAVQLGIKGVMISGETDYYRKYQVEMAEVFKETGFSHQVVVIPGLGHEVPENFSELLDAAIAYIMEKS